MPTNRNYSITFEAQFDEKSLEEKIAKLEGKKRSIKFDTDNKSIKDTNKAIKDVDKSTKDMDTSMQNSLLTFQAANMIFRKTVDILGSMVDQVYELDGATTEYRKVTELSGKSLDNYVSKISAMGSEVARTGKPKRLSLDVQMVNVH